MGKVISNPFANAFVNEAEGEDHEVSMGQNQLDTIIKMATELKAKMGENEKEIPAWIQDHISKAEN
jgi:sialic acid synthase SpsE